MLTTPGRRKLQPSAAEGHTILKVHHPGLDVAVRVLTYVNWSPLVPCAWSKRENEALPPREEERNISPSANRAGISEWNTNGHLPSWANVKVEVFVSPLGSDGVGMLAGTVKYISRVVKRSLAISGNIITTGPPVFLTECSITFAL